MAILGRQARGQAPDVMQGRCARLSVDRALLPSAESGRMPSRARLDHAAVLSRAVLLQDDAARARAAPRASDPSSHPGPRQASASRATIATTFVRTRRGRRRTGAQTRESRQEVARLRFSPRLVSDSTKLRQRRPSSRTRQKQAHAAWRRKEPARPARTVRSPMASRRADTRIRSTRSTRSICAA